METTNNGGATPQLDAVKPIWEVMGGQEDAVTTVTPPATEKDIQTEDTVATTEKPEEIKLEAPKVEEAVTDEKKEDKPAEEKSVETTEDKVEDTLELKVEDIKGVPEKYDEGSWKGVASDLGFELNEDSFEKFQETFKEKYVPREEAEQMRNLSKEKIFSTLKPEVATALELIEMGVPQELAFNPTKAQDEYLAMDSASLVRAELASRQGWDESMVDAKMEELIADQDALEVQAKIIRANVNTIKQDILQEQQQLVQRYTEQKQQEAHRQKVEANNQFKDVLTKESTFMGLKLSQEVKDAIYAKYEKGAYDEALNPAQAKLRAILQLEYGDKFAKVLQSKAKEEGKAEIVRKLADVPPKVNNGGSRVQVKVSDDHADNHPFANMPMLG